MIDKALFSHNYEEHAFSELKLIGFEKQLAHYYKEYKQPMLMPDLYGKTVKVSVLQFKEIYDMTERLASLLNMTMPDIYVYENFYYTVESKGLEDNWIEISAKTLVDLSKDEVMFLLAKEMCAIKLKHTYYYTIIEEALSAVNGVPIPGLVLDTIQNVGKVKFYRWMRISHYTSDNFAYLTCSNLSTAINAIVKTVLNDVFLARHVSIKEFIKQADNINALSGKTHALSKMDEQVPYAPFRIKNLMAYAASARGLQALKELQCGRGSLICSF